MWMKILGFVGVAWILQGVLVYFQIKDFQSKLRDIKEQGHFGVGTVKGRLGRGVIVMLNVDDENVITDAQIMTGITVFARFAPLDTLKHRHIKDVAKITEDMNPRIKSAVFKAINSLESSRSISGKEAQEDI